MSNEQKSTSVGSLTIDITNLHEALAVVEKIKVAAIEARAALASIGVAPAPLGELVAGEIVRDETPGLILAEMKRTNDLLWKFATNITCGAIGP